MKKLKNLLPIVLLFAVNMAFGQRYYPRPDKEVRTLNDSSIKALNLTHSTSGTVTNGKPEITAQDFIDYICDHNMHHSDSVRKYTAITDYYRVINDKEQLEKFRNILVHFEYLEILSRAKQKQEIIKQQNEATKRKLEAEYHIKL